MFTDTDSLCYEIFTENLPKDLEPHLNLFDTSNYHPDHFLFSLVNKKVIGKFKDELGGLQMGEFVGLKPKLYSFTDEGLNEKKVGKGISRSVLKRRVHHENYKSCLFDRRMSSSNMVYISTLFIP